MNITVKQKKELEKLCRKYKLRFLILHGSYAKGNSRKGSDLDMAYLGKKDHDLTLYFKVFNGLENIFGNSSDRELDVKELYFVDSLFRFHVVKDGILLYGNLTDYAEFKAYAYRDYMDSYDLRHLQDTLLKKSIQKFSQKYA